ncbi:MAG: peroxiredoxin family protein [Acidobacteriia bacterium]|nr:peroxiredoxin family protein [Terriglobia bacterium]
MYCRAQLGELQESLPQFHVLGAEVWAVSSTDTAEKLAGYTKVKTLTYPVLSDAALTLTKLYGLLNRSNGMMADPATVVIDRGGTVRFVRVDIDFRQRPSARDILDVVRNLRK